MFVDYMWDISYGYFNPQCIPLFCCSEGYAGWDRIQIKATTVISILQQNIISIYVGKFSKLPAKIIKGNTSRWVFGIIRLGILALKIAEGELLSHQCFNLCSYLFPWTPVAISWRKHGSTAARLLEIFVKLYFQNFLNSNGTTSSINVVCLDYLL